MVSRKQPEDSFQNQSVFSSRATTAATKYKVIVIGESMVGKTTFIQRYVTSSYIGHSQPTLGCDFKVKTIQLLDEKSDGSLQTGDLVQLHIWDTAGQERFRHVARLYYKETNGVFICFDITNPDSFEACKFWITDFEKNAPPGAVRVLIGLKCDLSDDRQVDYDQAQSFADLHSMKYFEVSSKEGDNVEDSFLFLATAVNDKNRKPPLMHQSRALNQTGLNSSVYSKDGSQLLDISAAPATANVTLNGKNRVGMVSDTKSKQRGGCC